MTKAMTLRETMLSMILMWSWYLMGTFFQACWTGGMLGSVQIVYVQGMSPTVSNEQGKAF